MLELLLQANGNGDAESVLGATLLIMLIALIISLVGLTIIAMVWAWAFGYYFKAAQFLEETKKLREAIEAVARKT